MDMLALLKSKDHFYPEPLEQFRTWLVLMGLAPALIDEQSQIIRQPRQ